MTRSWAQLVGVAFVTAVMLVPAAHGEVQLSATLDSQAYVSGQEMHLTLTFVNKGQNGVPLLKPAFLDDDFLIVEVSDLANVQSIPEHVHRRTILGQHDPVLLRRGETLQREFDLHTRFPAGLQPSRYLLSVAYHCSADRYPEKSEDLKDVDLHAEPLTFRVTARNAAQEDEYLHFRSVLGGSSSDLRIERARETLRKFPAGLFGRRVRIELAAALWQSKRLPQAIDQYRQVVQERGVSGATRLLAKQNLGLLHHELGQLHAAIEAIDGVDTRDARTYRRVWKREMRD